MEVNPDFVHAFKSFINETKFVSVLEKFKQVCYQLQIDENTGSRSFYNEIRNNAGKLSDIWQNLDNLTSDPVYKDGTVCCGSKVLIVGAGPCGLRMAIECALLGAKVVVVEARNYLSRNNVLHLWPFVINDIKKLGGKVVFRQFCVGGIDHISIKRLQLVLTKVSLLLGVQIYTPVMFEGIIEPDIETGAGWRVQLNPTIDALSETNFDVIVGANGKSRCLPDFERTIPKSRLAIAVTANFKNRKTTTEARVQEIGGVNYLYNQAFFHRLDDEINVKLENLVYFKDETHYFVMTVKKQSLLEKGVLKQNKSDRKELLSRENVDLNKLQELGKEVANCSVEGKLPNLEYALNHHEKEDVAMFDFTTLSVADHSCYAKERHGHTLLQCIVGDSLLEPFWPTGTGAARGFLSVLDAAWLIRGWFLKEETKLELIANRERLFQLLVQTLSPRLMKSKYELHTIDPETRYSSMRYAPSITPESVTNLYNTHDAQERYGDRLVKSFLTNSFKKRESANVSRNRSFREYETKEQTNPPCKALTDNSTESDNDAQKTDSDKEVIEVATQHTQAAELSTAIPSQTFQMTDTSPVAISSQTFKEEAVVALDHIKTQENHKSVVNFKTINSDIPVEKSNSNATQLVQELFTDEKSSDVGRETSGEACKHKTAESETLNEYPGSRKHVDEIAYVGCPKDKHEDDNHNIIISTTDGSPNHDFSTERSFPAERHIEYGGEHSSSSPTKMAEISDDSEGAADDTIFVTMMGKRDSFDEDDYVPPGISKRLIDEFEAKCFQPNVVTTQTSELPKIGPSNLNTKPTEESLDKSLSDISVQNLSIDSKSDQEGDVLNPSDKHETSTTVSEKEPTTEPECSQKNEETSHDCCEADSEDKNEPGTVKDYLKNKIKVLEKRLSTLSETLETMEAGIALIEAVSSLENDTNLLENEISTLTHTTTKTSDA